MCVEKQNPLQNQETTDYDFTNLVCSKGREYLEKAKELYMEEGKKYDTDKLRYDLLDPLFEEEVVKVLSLGAKKYSDGNWQFVKPFTERYYAATRRHLAAWRKGEQFDPETNISHLAHAACNLMFLLWGDRQCEKK